jgi:hypothetical protein
MAAIRDTLKYLFGMGGNPDDKNLTPEQKEQSDVQKWGQALEESRKFVADYHNMARRAVAAFLDSRGEYQNDRRIPNYRVNLFNSNIKTLQATLFAKMPKVEADRRFLDPNDEIARVAGEMMTRLLQNDMNDPDDGLKPALKGALEDRLVAGLGCARMKYNMTETTPDLPGEDALPQPDPNAQPQVDPATGQPVPPPPPESPQSQKADEWCEPVYTYWRDLLWSPCRTEAEITWKAFRAYMNKDKVTERFGKDVATAIKYNTTGPRLNEDKVNEIKTTEPQAEIWEIWDGEARCVYWYSKGYDKFLDQKDDPLGLDGFYPDGSWMVANTSTTKYLPKPDYELARTLYEEIDELESRIALLTGACKVVGVYDRQSKDIQRMLTEGVENQLIPVDNWAMFAERGGLKGMTDWLPLEQVTNALTVLTAQQQGRIAQLYQVTGMSDIMRGQATEAGATATEQRIKAQYGSVRIQSIQDEFAQFAQDLLNKKVQIIQRFYDPERIVKLSNIMNTPDAQYAQQAVALIKNYADFNIRIAIKAESLAQVDYDQRQQERTAFLQAVSQFMGQSATMLEQKPEMAPFMMQLLKFGVSGYKASTEMEGILDQMISQMQAAEQQKAQQPPQPSEEQIKQQAEAAAAQAEANTKMQLQQQQAASDAQLAAQKASADAQLAQADQAHKAQLAAMKEQAAEERSRLVEEMKNDRVAATDQLKSATAIIIAAIGAKTDMAAAELSAEQTAQKDLQV